MLSVRLFLAFSGCVLLAVLTTAYEDYRDFSVRSRRGGAPAYEYVDYVPSYDMKTSRFDHYGGGEKHYHHHHHSHKHHCKHCHKKYYDDHHHKKYKDVSLTGLLALLAPLALLPLITGAFAPVSMAPLVVPAMTQVTAGRRRRRSISSIHEYLNKVNPSGEYNDEVMAQYLKCSGMLDSKNHCIERLTCQYTAGTLNNLEKEVASLIIYTVIKNKFIPDAFKTLMRKAAAVGRQHPHRCFAFHCVNKKDVFANFGSF